MEYPQVHSLKQLPRSFNYPYRLAEIGWMPGHFYFHHNTVINGCYICISANCAGESETIVDGRLCKHAKTAVPHIGLIPPGTHMQSVRAVLHDEIFFHYQDDAAESIMRFFGEKNTRNFSFFLSEIPEDILTEIRRELEHLTSPGIADRLDQLAIRLFTEILLLHENAAEPCRVMRLKIHSVAAGLREGRLLSDLLKHYEIGGSSFYRDWHAVYGEPPRRYRLRHMLEKACVLLAQTELHPSEIAEKCGFESTVYFYQRFRTKTGMPPLAWREANKGHFFPHPDSENTHSSLETQD